MEVKSSHYTFAGLALVAPALFVQPAFADVGASNQQSDLANYSQRLPLAAVSLDGVTAYEPQTLAPLYEPYLARTIETQDLVALAQRIQERYRQDGYFLTQAIVPPQPDLESGFARIAVLEGHFSDVKVEGPARDVAAPYFHKLSTTSPAQLADLRLAILRAQNVPGLSVRTRIEPDTDDPRAHRLIVDARMKTVEGYLELSDRGQAPWAHGKLQARRASIRFSKAAIKYRRFTSPRRRIRANILRSALAIIRRC